MQESIAGISVVSGPIFQTTQWTQVPLGASGSSTTRARDLVFAGAFRIVSGGFPFAPSHVYSDGIIPLLGKAWLVRWSLFIVFSSA